MSTSNLNIFNQRKPNMNKIIYKILNQPTAEKLINRKVVGKIFIESTQSNPANSRIQELFITNYSVGALQITTNGEFKENSKIRINKTR